MMKHNKLVRDNIPAILDSKGLKYITHTVSGNELKSYMLNKLHEEVAEFSEEPSIEELADIQEVVYGILSAYGWDKSELDECASLKRYTNGGFTTGLILDEVVG